jgi:phosphomannomutase
MNADMNADFSSVCQQGSDERVARLNNPDNAIASANSLASASAIDPSRGVDRIKFGTDGWRAIIGADFNPQSVARVAEAAARIFRQEITPTSESSANQPVHPVVVIGYDCRLDAGRYAALAATVIASYGFGVVISDRYCPTPALCWTIARDSRAVGGLMLTSSHNPAEYLGIKLRMSDGGASPKTFTDKVEAALTDSLPLCFDEALANFAAAQNGSPLTPATPMEQAPSLRFTDIMAPYLDSLRASVDAKAIKHAGLRVVVDPLFGSGRAYLAGLLSQLGVEVTEVNGEADPTFNGLHPEPILPWIEKGATKVVELGYDACFVTDGDADRIGVIDDRGSYITSHRVLTLLIGHLVEDRGQTGRVIRTRAGSNLLRRQCDRLGLTLITKPIGFKWIYEEMLKGDVLIGGEESGGIGIPAHVRERDGLLMALMLTELIAQKGKRLHKLTEELLTELGTLEYARRDLRLTSEQKDALLTNHVHSDTIALTDYRDLFTPLNEMLISIDRGDGIKFDFASDAWLLVRPSGTEPLVRVYAEAITVKQVEALLDIGCLLARGTLETTVWGSA